MLKSPLIPQIEIKHVKHLSVCSCCAIEDGSIRQIVLGWQAPEPPHQAGSSSISVCATCRDTLGKAIAAQTPPHVPKNTVATYSLRLDVEVRCPSPGDQPELGLSIAEVIESLKEADYAVTSRRHPAKWTGSMVIVNVANLK